MPRKRWTDLSPRRRAATIALGGAELILTTAAVVDLTRRPARLIRGSKALWWVGVFVQPLGPIAYLLWGRGPRATGQRPV